MNNCDTSVKPDCQSMRPADPWRHFPVAMGYFPWQNLHTLYEPDKALQVGTIFPELNKPFEGRRIGC